MNTTIETSLRHNRRHELERQLTDLDGWVKLGASREVGKGVRRILKSAPLTAEPFDSALSALQASGVLNQRWLRLIEKSYRRMPKADRLKTKAALMSAYWLLGHPRQAARHVRGAELEPFDFYFAMNSLLATNRVEEAGALARAGRRMLARLRDPETRDAVHSALAIYEARRKNWEKSLEHNAAVKSIMFFQLNAIHSAAMIQVAWSLQAVRSALATVRYFAGQERKNLSLQPEDDNRQSLRYLERTLKGYQRHLEKIATRQCQKELGMSRPDVRKKIPGKKLEQFIPAKIGFGTRLPEAAEK